MRWAAFGDSLKASMSYEVYKTLHLLGAFALIASLGGAAVWAANGKAREDNTLRSAIAAVHGTALLVILVAGFGLLAKLGMMSAVPPWAWAKLLIWFALAACLSVAMRKPELGKLLFFAVPVLGGLAAWLAVTKPGGVPAATSAPTTSSAPTNAAPSAPAPDSKAPSNAGGDKR